MAPCFIHDKASTPADALTLKFNVSEDKKQLPYYMTNVFSSIIQRLISVT